MERVDEMPSGAARSRAADDADQLYTSGDVARLFGVDPKTVARWADAGKLDAMRTLGGHRRYRPDVVHELMENFGADDDDR